MFTAGQNHFCEGKGCKEIYQKKTERNESVKSTERNKSCDRRNEWGVPCYRLSSTWLRFLNGQPTYSFQAFSVQFCLPATLAFCNLRLYEAYCTEQTRDQRPERSLIFLISHLTSNFELRVKSQSLERQRASTAHRRPPQLNHTSTLPNSRGNCVSGLRPSFSAGSCN